MRHWASSTADGQRIPPASPTQPVLTPSTSGLEEVISAPNKYIRSSEKEKPKKKTLHKVRGVKCMNCGNLMEENRTSAGKRTVHNNTNYLFCALGGAVKKVENDFP